MITLQWSTLVLATATLIGATLGATANIVWESWNKRKKRDNLRRAIWAEMMTVRPYLAGTFGPEGQFLRKTIYENNADDLTILSDEEVEAIVAFYGHIINLQAAVNQSGNESFERNNAFAEAYMQSDVRVWFNHAVEQLYPHVDIDDGLDEVKIPGPAPM
ncbi:hypothetical protein [Haloferax gibbonsii]|nr:hypothetical protein [Haloferax gibbonsii]